MATFNKIPLSGSTVGRGILIGSGAVDTDNAVTLHAADGTNTDEVWLYADSNHTTEILLSVEWGGVTDPGHLIHQLIYPKAGLQLVSPGLIIAATASPDIAAFASVASKVTIFGWVIKES